MRYMDPFLFQIRSKTMNIHGIFNSLSVIGKLFPTFKGKHKSLSKSKKEEENKTTPQL